jgi:hypothetical protein
MKQEEWKKLLKEGKLKEYRYTSADIDKVAKDLVSFIGNESKKYDMGEFDVVNLMDFILRQTSKVHSKLRKK